MNHSTTISIDLAKTVFQVAVFNKAGKPTLNQEVSAKGMQTLVHKYPHAYIVMEACSSAHYWARKFIQRGHKVGLISPQFAARYRHGNKNDKNDCLAIFEASKSPQLHCVQVRTIEQQDMAMLHTYREGYKKQRVQISNRIRGLALEYGVTFPKGLHSLRKALPIALEDADNELSNQSRIMLYELAQELDHASELLIRITKRIEVVAKQKDACQRLQVMPGIGWLIASMLYAKLGDGSTFRCGRDASASVGVVPSHSGSGGEVTIGRISKRGDKYLRSLLANGARAVVQNIRDKQDGLSCWIRSLLDRKSYNATVIAVANKLVRMAWAILRSGEAYCAPKKMA